MKGNGQRIERILFLEGAPFFGELNKINIGMEFPSSAPTILPRK